MWVNKLRIGRIVHCAADSSPSRRAAFAATVALFAALGAQATVTQTGGEVARIVEFLNADKTRVRISEIYTFTNTASPGFITFSERATADVLVVGGGGAGGCGYCGGGGGGGGVIYQEGMAISAGTYAIAVGAGGVAGKYSDATSAGLPSNGGDSSVFGLTAIGGGHGGGFSLTSSATNFYAAATGGSGGGGGSFGPKNGDSTQWASSAAGAAGTAGQGKAGGKGYGHTSFSFMNGRGGGGGGASAAGKSVNNQSPAGHGGEGVTNSITGVARVYGSGGGGGTHTSDDSAYIATGGTNAGAGGIINSRSGQAGTDGFGGGGGGGAKNREAGGKGGSGVVIVRIRKPVTNGLILIFR